MSRVTRIVAAAMALLLVGGTTALLRNSNAAIKRSSERVDAQWAPLAAVLRPRYSRLGALTQVVRAAQGDRDLLRDIDASLAQWNHIKTTDVDALVVAANRIEGLAARLLQSIESSPRLRSAEGTTRAVQSYGRADPAASAGPFNAAVEQYDDTRNSLVKRPAAMVFGFQERRTFERPVT